MTIKCVLRFLSHIATLVMSLELFFSVSTFLHSQQTSTCKNDKIISIQNSYTTKQYY